MQGISGKGMWPCGVGSCSHAYAGHAGAACLLHACAGVLLDVVAQHMVLLDVVAQHVVLL